MSGRFAVSGMTGMYPAVVTVLRLWLAAWMLLNGLNYWVGFFPQPMGSEPDSGKMIVSMMEVGLFRVAKVVEIVGGVLLLLDWFTPLALVMLVPVSAIVFYNAAVLNGRFGTFWFRGLPYMGTIAFYLNLLLMLPYCRYLLPLLTWRVAVSPWSAPGGIRERLQGAPGWRRIALSMVLCALMFGYMAYVNARTGVWNAGAGLRPRQVVEAFLQTAYVAGRPDEAAQKYLLLKPDIPGPALLATAVRDGQPAGSRIIRIVAEGPTVFVVHRIGVDAANVALRTATGAAVEVGDIFVVRNGVITEWSRIGVATTAAVP